MLDHAGLCLLEDTTEPCCHCPSQIQEEAGEIPDEGSREVPTYHVKRKPPDQRDMLQVGGQARRGQRPADGTLWPWTGAEKDGEPSFPFTQDVDIQGSSRHSPRQTRVAGGPKSPSSLWVAVILCGGRSTRRLPGPWALSPSQQRA